MSSYDHFEEFLRSQFWPQVNGEGWSTFFRRLEVGKGDYEEIIFTISYISFPHLHVWSNESLTFNGIESGPKEVFGRSG